MSTGDRLPFEPHLYQANDAKELLRERSLLHTMLNALPRFSTLSALTMTVALFAAPVGGGAQTPAIEHRVVVATTTPDREQEVEASLERNVNALAAVGFEVAAIVGGDRTVLDRLLERKGSRVRADRSCRSRVRGDVSQRWRIATS